MLLHLLFFLSPLCLCITILVFMILIFLYFTIKGWYCSRLGSLSSQWILFPQAIYSIPIISIALCLLMTPTVTSVLGCHKAPPHPTHISCSLPLQWFLSYVSRKLNPTPILLTYTNGTIALEVRGSDAQESPLTSFYLIQCLHLLLASTVCSSYNNQTDL